MDHNILSSHMVSLKSRKKIKFRKHSLTQYYTNEINIFEFFLYIFLRNSIEPFVNESRGNGLNKFILIKKGREQRAKNRRRRRLFAAAVARVRKSSFPVGAFCGFQDRNTVVPPSFPWENSFIGSMSHRIRVDTKPKAIHLVDSKIIKQPQRRRVPARLIIKTT